MNEKYIKAMSRDDVGHWLAHFCKEWEFEGALLSPFDALRSILRRKTVYASKVDSITRYYREGASCFYNVPPSLWNNLINTNPSNREGYGLIFYRSILWHLGGRPCIYTDQHSELYWPENERFRLVYTNLSKPDQPTDWMHEREWRYPGDFIIGPISGVTYEWWWPCVSQMSNAKVLFGEFSEINNIYVLEIGEFVPR